MSSEYGTLDMPTDTDTATELDDIDDQSVETGGAGSNHSSMEHSNPSTQLGQRSLGNKPTNQPLFPRHNAPPSFVRYSPTRHATRHAHDQQHRSQIACWIIHRTRPGLERQAGLPKLPRKLLLPVLEA